jgi:hypothetical protein
MAETLSEVVYVDSKWWFRSRSHGSSFPSKIEALEAAICAARCEEDVLLRVYYENGSVESELRLFGSEISKPEPRKRSPKEMDRYTARSIRFYADKSPERIAQRLGELDQEIPLEHYVYRGGAAVLALATVMSLPHGRRNKFWPILGLVAAALQLQYSITGKNGLTTSLRRRGYRSRTEIQAERNSLVALRGDLGAIDKLSDPTERARKCLEVFL